MQSELDQAQAKIADIVEELKGIRRNSKLNNKEDPRTPLGSGTIDKKSIHFNFASTAISDEEWYEYSEYLTIDLELRNLDEFGTIGKEKNV